MLLALIVFYLILGMFMDVLSMQVATIPITFPIVTALGVDPIWFGIFIVLMCELGLDHAAGRNEPVRRPRHPPDKGGIEDAIWGALPYALIMILFTLLLIALPQARDVAAGEDVMAARTIAGGCRPLNLSAAYRARRNHAGGTFRRAAGAHRAPQSSPQCADCNQPAGADRCGGKHGGAGAMDAPAVPLDGVPLAVKDNILDRRHADDLGQRAHAPM